MEKSPINLKEKFTKFTAQWTPFVIAEMNDIQFKLAKIQDEYIWHDHKDTDEAFFVIEGSMSVEFRDGIVHLKEGDMYVIPRGVEHKPYADQECKILFLEPRVEQIPSDKESEAESVEEVWV